MPFRACCAVGAVLCLSATASAQIMLTEVEALARLSPQSPRVRALRAHIEVASADVIAARRFPNPRVTLSREAVAGVAEDYALVTQPLPVTGRRGFEIAAAESLARATQHRVADLERQARMDLRLAFADLVRAQAREQQLAGTVTSLRELAAILTKREQAGDAAGFDRLRAEREVVELETDLAVARAARAQSQAALAGFFESVVDPASLQATIAPRPRKDVPSAEALMTIAETTRGDLLALKDETEAARFAQRAAGRRAIPELDVVAGLKTSNVGDGDRGSVVSLLATVPLFDRGQAERARALARERQVTAEAEAMRLQLRATIGGLREQVVQRRGALDAYRSAAVTRSDDLQRIARVSYDEGERSILEVLDAYRTASTARLRLAELEAEAARVEIQLEYVTGWESLP